MKCPDCQHKGVKRVHAATFLYFADMGIELGRAEWEVVKMRSANWGGAPSWVATRVCPENYQLLCGHHHRTPEVAERCAARLNRLSEKARN